MRGSCRSSPQAGFVVSCHKHIKPLDPRAFLSCLIDGMNQVFINNSFRYILGKWVWLLEHNDCKSKGISDVRSSIIFSWCRAKSLHSSNPCAVRGKLTGWEGDTAEICMKNAFKFWSEVGHATRQKRQKKSYLSGLNQSCHFSQLSANNMHSRNIVKWS